MCQRGRGWGCKHGTDKWGRGQAGVRLGEGSYVGGGLQEVCEEVGVMKGVPYAGYMPQVAIACETYGEKATPPAISGDVTGAATCHSDPAASRPSHLHTQNGQLRHHHKVARHADRGGV